MKLSDLYSRNQLLSEGFPRVADGVSVERMLPSRESVSADGSDFKPFYHVDDLFKQIRKMREDGNLEAALDLAMGLLTKSYISGLNRQPVKTEAGNKYIFIRGDLDKMKWLNDESGLTHDGVNVIIRKLGDLITKHVEAKPGVDLTNANLDYVNDSKDASQQAGTGVGKFYHPHGDEFAGQVNITGLSDEQAGVIVGLIISGLMDVADGLATTLFYPNRESYQGKDQAQAVRATVSFSIALSDSSADKILQRSKNSNVRYAVTVDKQIISKYVKANPRIAKFINKAQNRSQGAGLVVPEGKNKALEAVQFRPGCLLLELDPLMIPRHEMLELENTIRSKRAYLQDPAGFCPLKCGDTDTQYIPLKEPYNGVRYA